VSIARAELLGLKVTQNLLPMRWEFADVAGAVVCRVPRRDTGTSSPAAPPPGRPRLDPAARQRRASTVPDGERRRRPTPEYLPVQPPAFTERAGSRSTRPPCRPATPPCPPPAPHGAHYLGCASAPPPPRALASAPAIADGGPSGPAAAPVGRRRPATRARAPSSPPPKSRPGHHGAEFRWPRAEPLPRCRAARSPAGPAKPRWRRNTKSFSATTVGSAAAFPVIPTSSAKIKKTVLLDGKFLRDRRRVTAGRLRFSPFWSACRDGGAHPMVGDRVQAGGNTVTHCSAQKTVVSLEHARAEIAGVTARREQQFPGRIARAG